MKDWQAVVLVLLLLVGGAADRVRGQPLHFEPGKAPKDSAQKYIVWNELTRLGGVRDAADVAFTSTGRNIVNPVQIVWVLRGPGELVAMASKPIQETASAGEEMGRRGAGLLRSPQAVVATEDGTYVLEAGDRLIVLRSGSVDTLQLQKGAAGARDLSVGPTGLLHALLGTEVRVYTDPPRGAPLWKFDLDPKLRPAVGMAVSSRGEIYIASTGALALGVYDLDAQGRFRRVRGIAARDLGVRRVSGLALTPAMLLPVEGKEGWVGEDRFVILVDAETRTLLALDAATLKLLGHSPIAPLVSEAQPGRIDVSNRGQIAIADAGPTGAYALPTRVLAGMLQTAKMPWRILTSPDAAPHDSTKAASGNSKP